MIITSNRQLEIGKIYTEKELDTFFSTPEYEFLEYRFQVIKEVSQEEYIAFIEKEYASVPLSEFILNDYFYDVSMD